MAIVREEQCVHGICYSIVITGVVWFLYELLSYDFGYTLLMVNVFRHGFELPNVFICTCFMP